MYFPKPSLNENDLAFIERANTASRAYSAGQYVSWHGRTGRVKADILQGVSLDDTLFEYDDGGALSALNSKIIIENQSVPISGNGGMYESYITIPNLHPGYSAYIIGSRPTRFDQNHCVHAIHQIGFGGNGDITSYIEHNLNSDNPSLLCHVLYIKC